MSGREKYAETVCDKTGADAPGKYNDTIEEPEELFVEEIGKYSLKQAEIWPKEIFEIYSILNS